MRVSVFQQLPVQLGDVSRRQHEKVVALPTSASKHQKVVDILEKAAAPHLSCPRRRSRRSPLRGHAHGLQRFRCIGCGKTVNAHRAVNLRAGVPVQGALHVQNANAHHSRYRAWVSRFHGVAPHYLPNYPGWRRAPEAQRIASPEVMLSSAVGTFPHLPGT